jgi:hypothetical protein
MNTTTKAQRTNKRHDAIWEYRHRTRDYWAKYEARVRALEEQGCTRSDAQGIIDAEDMRHE